MRTVRIAAAVFALALPAAAAAQAAGDIVLQGGAIYTLDAGHPWASALVIADGRIAYVGDDGGARAHAGPGARTIALAGRMVLPGFHDAHIHPMSGALRLLRCRLGEFKTAPRVYAAIRACAAAKSGHDWLLGSGWSPEVVAHPTKEQLDALVPGRPAYLATEDGFTAWANSQALKIAGIDAKGPDTAGIERDPKTHEPTGKLKDGAVDRLRRVLPKPTEAEYREALRRSTAMANRFGITSVFDADAAEQIVDAYRAADLAGELTLRVVAAQSIDPARGPEQVDEMVARRDRVAGRRFRADAAKIFLDGEIDMHTAALLEPYEDTPGARGDLYMQPDALDAVVRRLDAEGFLIHMHVMGDRSVRAGLDALELAAQANGPRDRRDQLAHIGVADPADIARFGRLGIAANFTPMWFSAGDPAFMPAQAVLGPKRARWMYPMASVAAAGGRIIASSDWPSPSMNPLDAIQVAVTRQPLDSSKPARQPQERVGLAAVLAAYTRDAAWAAREDPIDGTLEAGKAADLVVLDRNLFKTKPAALHEAHVLLTLLDGEPVYRDPRFAWPNSSK
ncbi:MAG: amidohydrolase [Alphaproteobacteria bacterium]|nr:amidohydrolase [Alphaproteobacteria bacterium]